MKRFLDGLAVTVLVFLALGVVVPVVRGLWYAPLAVKLFLFAFIVMFWAGSWALNRILN